MKTIINSEAKYLIKDKSKDFHSEYGMIKKEELDKDKAITNTGKEFSVFDAPFIDIYEKIKRLAQIIMLKDIGTILAETGINHQSKVLEAGSGSGALGCFMAHICKEVISYDIREDHQKVASGNAEYLGLKNITFKIGDIREKIDEKDVDLIVLDMPDPWKALKNAADALKKGGFLVVYSPAIPQVSDTVEEAKKLKESLLYLKTIENIQREWEFDERKIRPKTSYINHTGFLTFIRKI
jgi:tRNA (adenine57-N1/adenine58-N1)-methyltransferase